MGYPIINAETTYRKSRNITVALCTFMVNSIIFMTGFELIVYFAGETSDGCAALFMSLKQIPIVAYLTVLLFVHFILMLPGMIAGFVIGRNDKTGFFYMCAILCLVEVVYYGFMFYDALIPWWLKYLSLAL